MPENEIRIEYPIEWEEEYKLHGFPKVWIEAYSELFVKDRGVYGTFGMSRKSRYCFADYALMYLLRRDCGLESNTYFRLAVEKTKARTTHHPIMREKMGDAFEKLQKVLWDNGFNKATYLGEPDLFCWKPNSKGGLFAEAKGPRDKMRKPQEKWFRVCREALPEVEIRVYRLVPVRKVEAAAQVTPPEKNRTAVREQFRSVAERRTTPNVFASDVTASFADLPDGGRAEISVLNELRAAIAKSSLILKVETKRISIWFPNVADANSPIFIAAIYKTRKQVLLWSWAGETLAGKLPPLKTRTAVKGLLDHQKNLFEKFGGVLAPSGGQFTIVFQTLRGREGAFVQELEILANKMLS